MKILSFCFIFFAFCITSIFSQNWFVGGHVAFNIDGKSEPYDNIYYTYINISPIIGYNLNKFDIGLNPIFQYRKNEQENYYYTHIRESFGIGIGIFSRYNFITFGKLSILGQLGIDYVFSFDEESASTYRINEHNINIKIIPVLEYRLLANLSLYTNFRAIASYSYNKYENGNYERSSHSFRSLFLDKISLSDITIGFYILF